MIPSFECSALDRDLIRQIAGRAVRVARQFDIQYDAKDAEMDLTACHANGCPLDLPGLLGSDFGTFGHDVFGIRRFLNRSTGKLTRNFHPRTAQSQSVVSS